MSNQEKTQQKRADERRRLLSLCSPDVSRIQVRDEKGKVRWRGLQELVLSDEIQIKQDGMPVTMKGSPGRKEFKSKIGPVNVVVAKLMADKQAALKDDPLLRVVKTSPESTDVLQNIMVGLAEEAGSIAFEREEAERLGEPTSQISGRRISALKAVADTWLRRKEQVVARTIDMDSPVFQTIMGYVFETFRGAMVDSELDDNAIKVVFSRVAKKIDAEEWKAEAKNRMKRDV